MDCKIVVSTYGPSVIIDFVDENDITKLASTMNKDEVRHLITLLQAAEREITKYAENKETK